jgi:hypothetical protein
LQTEQEPRQKKTERMKSYKQKGRQVQFEQQANCHGIISASEITHYKNVKEFEAKIEVFVT